MNKKLANTKKNTIFAKVQDQENNALDTYDSFFRTKEAIRLSIPLLLSLYNVSSLGREKERVAFFCLSLHIAIIISLTI